LGHHNSTHILLGERLGTSAKSDTTITARSSSATLKVQSAQHLAGPGSIETAVGREPKLVCHESTSWGLVRHHFWQGHVICDSRRRSSEWHEDGVQHWAPTERTIIMTMALGWEAGRLAAKGWTIPCRCCGPKMELPPFCNSLMIPKVMLTAHPALCTCGASPAARSGDVGTLSLVS
jgi:hypothetical protein